MSSQNSALNAKNLKRKRKNSWHNMKEKIEMKQNIELSTLNLDDLHTEEKKMKKNATITAFIIGFLVGVIIYGVARNGFGFLYVFLPLLLIFGIYKNSKKSNERLLQIRAEIKSRGNDSIVNS